MLFQIIADDYDQVVINSLNCYHFEFTFIEEKNNNNYFSLFSVHALANKKFPGDPGYNENETQPVDYLKMIQSPIESPPDPLPLFQKRDNILQ